VLARENTSVGVLLSSNPRRVRNVILIATRHTTMPLCYEYFDTLGLSAALAYAVCMGTQMPATLSCTVLKYISIEPEVQTK
jgi:hypothetical protein